MMLAIAFHPLKYDIPYHSLLEDKSKRHILHFFKFLESDWLQLY